MMPSLVRAPLAMIQTIVEHRFLCRQLTRRFFSTPHAGLSLGWLWSLVGTAVQFLIFLVVFSKIIGIRVANPPDVSFGVYLMTGLVPFLALNGAISRAVVVFPTNVALVQKVSFPPEVLVLADSFGALAHHGLAFALVAAVALVLVQPALTALVWLPVGVLLVVLWAVGSALVASVAGAFLPDIREVLTLLLQVLFYAAPIVYPLELVNEPLLGGPILANPVTGLVGIIRAGLIGGTPPGWPTLLLLSGGGLALVAVGATALNALRDRIPDVL
jgi:lipopolysaccharide transport system permease protein